MKERMIYEERMQEIAYENTLLQNKIENLEEEMQRIRVDNERETQSLREDRD